MAEPTRAMAAAIEFVGSQINSMSQTAAQYGTTLSASLAGSLGTGNIIGVAAAGVVVGPRLQQRGGEVRAPHHDRVGHRAEQHQVQHQPVGVWQPAVRDGDPDRGGEPQQQRQIAQPGTSTCGRPAHSSTTD